MKTFKFLVAGVSTLLAVSSGWVLAEEGKEFGAQIQTPDQIEMQTQSYENQRLQSQLKDGTRSGEAKQYQHQHQYKYDNRNDNRPENRQGNRQGNGSYGQGYESRQDGQSVSGGNRSGGGGGGGKR